MVPTDKQSGQDIGKTEIEMHRGMTSQQGKDQPRIIVERKASSLHGTLAQSEERKKRGRVTILGPEEIRGVRATTGENVLKIAPWFGRPVGRWASLAEGGGEGTSQHLYRVGEDYRKRGLQAGSSET